MNASIRTWGLALIGLPFGLQTHTWPTGDPSVGAITNLYRSSFLPPAKKDPRKKIQPVTGPPTPVGPFPLNP